jgi:hypothetical protein
LGSRFQANKPFGKNFLEIFIYKKENLSKGKRRDGKREHLLRN